MGPNKILKFRFFSNSVFFLFQVLRRLSHWFFLRDLSNAPRRRWLHEGINVNFLVLLQFLQHISYFLSGLAVRGSPPAKDLPKMWSWHWENWRLQSYAMCQMYGTPLLALSEAVSYGFLCVCPSAVLSQKSGHLKIIWCDICRHRIFTIYVKKKENCYKFTFFKNVKKSIYILKLLTVTFSWR